MELQEVTQARHLKNKTIRYNKLRTTVLVNGHGFHKTNCDQSNSLIEDENINNQFLVAK